MLEPLVWHLLERSRRPEAAVVEGGFVLAYPVAFVFLVWFVPALLTILSACGIFAGLMAGHAPSAVFIEIPSGAVAIGALAHYVYLSPKVWFDREKIERRRGRRVVATIRWDQLVEVKVSGYDESDYTLRDEKGARIRTSSYCSGMATFARIALERARPRAIDPRACRFLEWYRSTSTAEVSAGP